MCAAKALERNINQSSPHVLGSESGRVLLNAEAVCSDMEELRLGLPPLIDT